MGSAFEVIHRLFSLLVLHICLYTYLGCWLTLLYGWLIYDVTLLSIVLCQWQTLKQCIGLVWTHYPYHLLLLRYIKHICWLDGFNSNWLLAFDKNIYPLPPTPLKKQKTRRFGAFGSLHLTLTLKKSYRKNGFCQSNKYIMHIWQNF